MARDGLNKSMDALFPQVRREWHPDHGLVYVPDDSVCRVCGERVVDGRWSYCSTRCRTIAQGVQRMFIWERVREQVLERDDYTCQRCGVSKQRQWRAYHQSLDLFEDWSHVPEAPTNGYFQVDHIQRLDDGGHPLDEQNLQTLCRACHERKTATENAADADHDDQVDQADAVPLANYLPARSD